MQAIHSDQHQSDAIRGETASEFLNPQQIDTATLIGNSGDVSDGDVIVWQSHSDAGAFHLPAMRMHTVSLRRERAFSPGVCGATSASHPLAQELLIVPAYERCSLRALEETYRSNVSFSTRWFHRDMARCAGRGIESCSPRLRFSAAINDSVLRALVDALCEAVTFKRGPQRGVFDAISRAIGAHLLAYHCVVSSRCPPSLSDADQDRLDAFLRSDFSRHWLEADAAALLGMKVSHFVRLLRNRTGSTFTRYMLELRLKHSYDLISTGQANVTQAAMDARFVNLAHFSRVFRSHFGVPPSSIKR